MKRIIVTCIVLIFFTALTVSAQQNSYATPITTKSSSHTVNPNIDRMRIVKQKMAAEKPSSFVATAKPKVVPMQQSPQEIAGIKAANRAQLQTSKAGATKK